MCEARFRPTGNRFYTPVAPLGLCWFINLLVRQHNDSTMTVGTLHRVVVCTSVTAYGVCQLLATHVLNVRSTKHLNTREKDDVSNAH